ncbi:hypothetical protein JQN64_27880, partial [Escherichia coli]|nr:hypothetical protein [Escherichia coli]
MSTDGTQAVFDVLEPFETELMFQNGSQIQIFDSMAEVATSSTIRKFQYAALIRKERLLLVWHDDLGAILSQAMEVESRILGLVWGTSKNPFSGFDSAVQSSANSTLGGSTMDFDMGKKEDVEVVAEEVDADIEKGQGPKESLARPLIFTSAIFVGLAMVLITVPVIGLGNRALLLETMTDTFYPRLLL